MGLKPAQTLQPFLEPMQISDMFDLCWSDNQFKTESAVASVWSDAVFLHNDVPAILKYVAMGCEIGLRIGCEIGLKMGSETYLSRLAGKDGSPVRSGPQTYHKVIRNIRQPAPIITIIVLLSLVTTTDLVK